MGEDVPQRCTDRTQTSDRDAQLALHRRRGQTRANCRRTRQQREAPHPCQQTLGWPAKQQQPTTLAQRQRPQIFVRRDGSHPRRGDLGDHILRPRGTLALQRTLRAPRLLRGAHSGAQLHQCLRQHPRRSGLDDLLRDVPVPPRFGTLLRWIGDGLQPRQHACDVAINQCCRLVVRDRGDRTGGVAADPWDLPQQLGVARQLPTQVGLNMLRTAMQQPSPPVVTEPTPSPEHILDIGFGQRGDIGKPPQERRPIGPDRLDPRLLQHHFRDPDRVRVTGLPPL